MKTIRLFLAFIIISAGCSSEYITTNSSSLFKCIKTIPRTDVAGKIVSAQSGKTIPGAKVFLNKTSFLTEADSSGAFEFKDVPSGIYNLCIYDIPSNYSVHSIEVRPDQTNFFEIVIDNRFDSLSTILSDKTKSKAWLKEQKKFFLNKMRNNLFNERLNLINDIVIGKNSECKLLNPDAVNIRISESPSQNLTVFTADEPLYIINRFLGYSIFLVMKKAAVSKSLGYYYMKLEADYAFTELSPADETEHHEWLANRHISFTGSARHFFSSLTAGNSGDEGFMISIPSSEGAGGGSSSTPGGSARTNPEPEIVHDINKYVKPSGISYEYVFTLENVFQVTHLYRYPDISKRVFMNISKQFSSLLSLPAKQITINTAGNIVGDKSIFTTGFWATQQISDLLPENYIP